MPGEAEKHNNELVDLWMKDPPRRIKVWLKSIGMPDETIPERQKAKKIIMQQMRVRGLWEWAEQWKREQCIWLQNNVPELEKCSWGVAREICWRVIEEVVHLNHAAIVAAKESVAPIPEEQAAHLEALPIDVRWLYKHPGLCVKNDQLPVVAKAVLKYEEENPCPHAGVRNRYTFYREHQDQIPKFFASVDKLLMEASRPAPPAAAETPPEEEEPEVDEEQESIADLERQLGEWSQK